MATKRTPAAAAVEPDVTAQLAAANGGVAPEGAPVVVAEPPPTTDVGVTVQLTHLPACPADPDRVEPFTATRPPSDPRGAATVVVTRCMDCGASVVTVPAAGVVEAHPPHASPHPLLIDGTPRPHGRA